MPRVLVLEPHPVEGPRLVRALRDELAVDAWGAGVAAHVAIDLVASADEAAGLLRTVRYEVLVLDADAEGVGGLAPARGVRVLLVGATPSGLARLARRFGAHATLVRPTTELVICAIVGVWVASGGER